MNPNIITPYNTYLGLIKTNFPKSKVENNNNLVTFFQSVHNSFIMSDILTIFEFVTSNSNVYNLIIEYKFFYSRLLTTLPLNDLFLINNLLRLITEKQYRIIYGLNFPNYSENRVRKSSRSKMDNELENLVDKQLHDSLNNLYRSLSSAIHHTNSSSSDFHDIQRRLRADNNIPNSVQQTLDELEQSFSNLVFIKVINNNPDKLTTAAKARMENNLENQICIRILQLF